MTRPSKRAEADQPTEIADRPAEARQFAEAVADQRRHHGVVNTGELGADRGNAERDQHQRQHVDLTGAANQARTYRRPPVTEKPAIQGLRQAAIDD
jgi:hypothetical protein